ncbi:MAG: DUF2214 domain-containing protein [Rhizobium sp.]|nr:DUF2214 domain-containing protein [Rhizobium sp.]
MEPLAWLEWFGSLPFAAFLRRNVTAYVFVNAAHILGISLLLGAILPLDLRLMGIIRVGTLSELVPLLMRVAATGLALASLTGLMLFSVKPAEYAGNPAFLIKMGLLALGMINVAALHRNVNWPMAKRGATPSVTLRLLAGLSFATWLAALLAGRWIGFV